MGRIVSNFYISLDGVVEAPEQWQFPYFNDQFGEAVSRSMGSTDAFLMGRTLYDEWSSYWPGREGRETGLPGEPAEGAARFASFINNVPKYVVSSTLKEPAWANTTVVSGDVAGRLKELKAETEGDISTSGSATLVRWLLANRLLDELRLLIHPIVVGHGRRLFDQAPECPLRLVHAETFATGVLDVIYAPEAGAGVTR
ncbi:MAG: dihydrofolate reductase family protein [Candidatus Dormibacteraeota bacterium]|nr:dihydrofolate reductase family protein [Candidatus Dormibacteraeota bacterium]